MDRSRWDRPARRRRNFSSSPNEVNCSGLRARVRDTGSILARLSTGWGVVGKKRHIKQVARCYDRDNFRTQRRNMMKTQQFLQASLNGWRAIPLRWGWLSLSLLFVATLVLYAARQGAPVLVGAGTNAGIQSDAATQAVLNYIRVHESVSERALPLDP